MQYCEVQQHVRYVAQAGEASCLIACMAMALEDECRLDGNWVQDDLRRIIRPKSTAARG